MKRSALVLAVGMFGAAACSHHDERAARAANEQPSSTSSQTASVSTPQSDVGDTTPHYERRDVTTSTTNPAVPGIPAMRDAISQVMRAEPKTSDADIATALNAIAGALVDMPDGNTGDGVARIKRNVLAMDEGDATHKSLEVHASLVQAIEAVRTVNNPTPNPAISTAAQNLKTFDPNRPMDGQMAAVRATICSVGNAVALAANTQALDCGNATASAK